MRRRMDRSPHLQGHDWSGQRDSNPRIPAWEAGALPLGYARSTICDYTPSGRTGSPVVPVSGRTAVFLLNSQIHAHYRERMSIIVHQSNKTYGEESQRSSRATGASRLHETVEETPPFTRTAPITCPQARPQITISGSIRPTSWPSRWRTIRSSQASRSRAA